VNIEKWLIAGPTGEDLNQMIENNEYPGWELVPPFQPRKSITMF
jgi:hypothetical protein